MGSDSACEAARSETIRQACGELGYIERKNIAIEYRSAERNTDSASELAAELARLKVDIIVACGRSTLVPRGQERDLTIPIVMVGFGADPVAAALLKVSPDPAGTSPG